MSGEYELPPVCILAGGKGTRLGTRVQDTPKPLLEVAGQPFLLHQLKLLAAHGATQAVICVGYLGERIEQTIGQNRFGVQISYSYDGPGLDGTLGAIRRAASHLGRRFLVLYGDTYLRIDYRAVARSWEHSGLSALMTVLRNEGRWDISNVRFDGSRVLSYDKRRPHADMEWIDYGLGGLTAAALDPSTEQMHDLSELQHVLAARGELFGYAAPERFYEIGTPAGLAETESFLRSLETQATRDA
ncbi:MAG TPA: sugar phosphate nucleotidyltransferase [Solirubrobacteraceae bacterium]|nr:sugar phosphate nucleotidyltransferase [Solirubrobacteraceae bacterium]